MMEPSCRQGHVDSGMYGSIPFLQQLMDLEIQNREELTVLPVAGSGVDGRGGSQSMILADFTPTPRVEPHLMQCSAVLYYTPYDGVALSAVDSGTTVGSHPQVMLNQMVDCIPPPTSPPPHHTTPHTYNHTHTHPSSLHVNRCLRTSSVGCSQSWKIQETYQS